MSTRESPRLPPRGRAGNQALPVRLHQGKLTKDPYALAEDCFLAARDNEIVLMDGNGALEVMFLHAGRGTCMNLARSSPARGSA